MTWTLVALAVVGVIALIYWQDRHIVVSHIEIAAPDLPSELNDVTIAVVADLHSRVFGVGQSQLLRVVEKIQPDMIVMPGDAFDYYRPDPGPPVQWAQGAVKIAPVFYSTGNHEARLADCERHLRVLQSRNITVLQNEWQTYAHLLQVRIVGIDDPAFASELSDREYMEAQLAELIDPAYYNIVLSHRPDFFDLYAEAECDLVVSGHAHGGQVRLPIIGGLYAPNQGLFPKYTSGRHTEGRTNMVVSRGLGRSRFPFRVNNSPEIVVVKLVRSSGTD